MIITVAKVFICSPGRNFVTLKIETDEGIYGLGDATLNGRELSVATYLEEYLIPCLKGRNPFDTEDIWQYFYLGGYWKNGSVSMTAIGAIDMALWDIKGKVCNVPLFNLLGGKSRNKILAYTHAYGKNIKETIRKISFEKEKGFTAIRVQSGLEGFKNIYGISTNENNYEPAIRGGLPVEEKWSSEKYLNFIPPLFKTVREEFGEDIKLLHDCHHRLSPMEAARIGKELEPFHLFWLEDPIHSSLQQSFRLIRQHTSTPIATGEIFSSIQDCSVLISEQLIDYLRMTISHGGGITPMMKIAAMCEIHHIKTGCHGASDMSPICMAAALHFDMAVHNFGIQEYMGHDDLTNEVFPHSYYVQEGFLYLPEVPGLGVDFNETLAKKYPYQEAYLPVNRLEDGTMFNW